MVIDLTCPPEVPPPPTNYSSSIKSSLSSSTANGGGSVGTKPGFFTKLLIDDKVTRPLERQSRPRKAISNDQHGAKNKAKKTAYINCLNQV